MAFWEEVAHRRYEDEQLTTSADVYIRVGKDVAEQFAPALPESESTKGLISEVIAEIGHKAVEQYVATLGYNIGYSAFMRDASENSYSSLIELQKQLEQPESE